MSDERRRRARWPWVVLLLLAIYVLSIGPVIGRHRSSPLPTRARKVAGWFCKPMDFIAQRSQTVHIVMNHYADWWADWWTERLADD